MQAQFEALMGASEAEHTYDRIVVTANGGVAADGSVASPAPRSFTLSGLSDAYESRQIQGAVDMIRDGNADVALGPIMISHQTMEVSDFSTPFLSTGHILIIPKPETMQPGVRPPAHVHTSQDRSRTSKRYTKSTRSPACLRGNRHMASRTVPMMGTVYMNMPAGLPLPPRVRYIRSN